MRDLHKILNLFAKECAMDYCPEFDAIKSVLDYCNDNVKSLNKVRFRGGNEDVVDEICKRLQDYFLKMEYIDVETKKPLPKANPIFRKIIMFLLVNTDATYKYNLKDDPGLAHVIEICPLLPKYLLVAIIWELNLDQFFYEALAHCPCWFSFQYYENATDSLKHIKDPYEVLIKVENMARAIFISITKSKAQHINFVDKKIILGKLYDFTMNLLRQFYTPDAEKFKTFKKNEFFTYSGYAINHILEMIIFAFDVYEEKNKLKPDFDVEVYDICASLSNQNPTSEAESHSLVKEFQLKVITALLNSLQYNVMLVKIDVFMHWVEVDLNNKETLQSVIGVKSFLVGERMIANRDFNHDVAHQLKSIAIRPKTLEEQITDATIGEILGKLSEPLERHVKKAWFDELFKKPVALGNDECLQSIKDNIKLFGLENAMEIVDYIDLEQKVREQSEEEIENEDMEIDSALGLTQILLAGVEIFKPADIITLINYEVKKFGKDVNRFQAERFSERATEFLNKFSNSFDELGFLCLCFENPQVMWGKMFDVACNSEEHIGIFCSMVKLMRPLSNDYFYPLLNSALRDDRIQQKFFSQLLCSIYFELCFERQTDFFKRFFNSSVNEMLDAERYTDLIPLVKCLNLIVSKGNKDVLPFGEATAPVLLMAAQIMENVRWDLLTYSNEKDEILKECAQFVQNTIKGFLPVAREKDKKWIKKSIRDSYRPLTQYYFQRFSLTPDQPPKKFDEFLIPSETHTAADVEMFLISNFIRCTTKETDWLARSDRLLPHMSDMILTLGVVVNETENPNAVLNYRNCMVNYANIVQKYLIPGVAKDTIKVEQLITKLLKIIEFAPAAIYEEMFMNFERLLLEVMQQCDVPVNETVTNNIRKNILKMKDCKGKELFLQKYTTLVTENLS
ncbi:uncharacterized protein LOC129912635 [Episyrphus balteatus]|uniref:uncharacterized protein LOC129912635 n=1 Tax=Episyrphus balteatus TaxID=286459 RepID=UPI00248645C8|nr:uncharacterized protein LOC129912635 [Episyrphus balteatus]